MYTFTVDGRNGAATNTINCVTCCCEALALKPGETALVMLKYAVRVMQIGGRATLNPSFDHTVEINDSACSAATSGGFVPPSNTNYRLATAVNTTLTFDLDMSASPSGNTFRYAIDSLRGPQHGTVAPVSVAANNSAFTYTPNNGFEGYDYFYYKMTDAQNRSRIYVVEILVGRAVTNPRLELMCNRPYINKENVIVDCANHTVRFPIHVPYSVRPCEKFKLTILQKISDCHGGEYEHESCYDISVKSC